MKEQHAEPQQQCDLEEHQDQAARGQRQQEVAPAHGRGHEALEQLALPHVYQGEADAPHSRVHQVHAQQAGNQEVDVARPRLGVRDARGRNGILASRGGLQHVVHLGVGEHAFRPRRIVMVVEASFAVGLNHHVELTQAQSLQRGGGIEHLGVNLRVAR